MTVFLDGIISRPILSVPWTKERILEKLRENLSRRIQTGSWKNLEEYEEFDEEYDDEWDDEEMVDE